MEMDRRKHPRFNKTFPIIIHRPYNERKIETIDISLGGAAIHYSQRYYHKDQVVYIEVILSEGESIFTDARVAWISPKSVDAEMYKVGLEFTGMSEFDKEKLKSAIEQ